MHKPFSLDLADMYNYIKMVLAQHWVQFNFIRFMTKKPQNTFVLGQRADLIFKFQGPNLRMK